MAAATKSTHINTMLTVFQVEEEEEEEAEQSQSDHSRFSYGTDTSSSNVTSPITPSDHKSTSFPLDTDVMKQFATSQRQLAHNNDSLKDTTYRMKIKPYFQQLPQQQADALEQSSGSVHFTEKARQVPASVGNSISLYENRTLCTTFMKKQTNKAGTDPKMEDNDYLKASVDRDNNDDLSSMGDSADSVNCEDFPSPPSSTPSLLPRSIVTLADSKKSHSRFTEVFDLDGTDLEWDYTQKYRQSKYHPLPQQSLHNVSTILDDLNGSNKQNKRLNSIMNGIGRSPSTASLSVATNKSRSSSISSNGTSIRGIMRSLSTTSFPQQKTTKLNSDDRMTKAALAAVAASTKDELLNVDKGMKNTATLINDENSNNNSNLMSPDNRRHMISQLVNNAMRKTPIRRHTTKVVNMQPSATRQLVRRTVIYVNDNHEINNDFVADFTNLCQPHRPAPAPPRHSQPYRYGKQLPPTPNIPSSSSTSSTSSSSSSSTLSSTSSSSPSTALRPPAPIPKSSYLSSSLVSNKQERQPSHMKGVELREMDDGSTEWGIIKKEGRRKSFFPIMDQSTQQSCSSKRYQQQAVYSDMSEDDEDHIENRGLAFMGLKPVAHIEKQSTRSTPPPIPRRSPQRKPSTLVLSKSSSSSSRTSSRHNISTKTGLNSRREPLSESDAVCQVQDDSCDSAPTEVYYAPELTLPSLLQMIAQASKQQNQ